MMRFKWLLLVCCALQLLADDSALDNLLLTPHRLKRLKRDRERETDRWSSFEKRVAANIDSPEHGVELAIYYAVTGDTAKGKEALAWTLSHACESLPVQLVRSATTDLQSPEESQRLNAMTCTDAGHPLSKFGLAEATAKEDGFLLSLRPAQVEHPSWQQHVAALALVGLDPNGQAAQFLQGWAIEDRFQLHSGPGMVYEFIWADPYLPGVSYQNMLPWEYREGSLLARTDWSGAACWVHLSGDKREEVQCPAGFLTRRETFGTLVLQPLDDVCLDVSPGDPRVTMIVSNLRPGSKLTYSYEKRKQKAEADAAGLWRVPVGVAGTVCRAK